MILRFLKNSSILALFLPLLFSCAKLSDGGVLPIIEDLRAPENLRANAISSSSIALAWDDKSPDPQGKRLSEKGFYIERARSLEGDYARIGEVGENVEEFTDSGLDASTTYYYRVMAFIDAGVSQNSNTAYAATLAQDFPQELNFYCVIPTEEDFKDIEITAALNWSVSTSEYWLRLNYYSGHGPSTIRLYANCERPAGDYQASITIDIQSIGQIEIPVYLKIRFPGDPDTYYPFHNNYMMKHEQNVYNIGEEGTLLRVYRKEWVELEGGATFPVEIEDYRSFITFRLTAEDIQNIRFAGFYFEYFGSCARNNTIMAVEKLSGNVDAPQYFGCGEDCWPNIFNYNDFETVEVIVLSSGYNDGHEYIEVTDLNIGYNAFRIRITNWDYHYNNIDCNIYIRPGQLVGDADVVQMARLDIFRD